MPAFIIQVFSIMRKHKKAKIVQTKIIISELTIQKSVPS